MIEPDKENPISYPEPRTKEETDALSPKEIVEIIGDMGVVGLGGATFPTRVKAQRAGRKERGLSSHKRGGM